MARVRWDFIANLLGHTKAALPALGLPGFIRRITDDILGPWYLSAALKWYSVLNGAVNCDEYSSFNAALTAIGATKRVLTLTSAQTCATTATVPATTHLKIVPGAGGQISVDSGQTLSIDGPVSAPRNQQIFYGSGTVKLWGGQKDVPADWFGAGDAAINKAIAATNYIAGLAVGGNVDLTAKIYPISAMLTATNQTGLQIVGSGVNSTYLQPSANLTDALLKLSDIRNGRFADFTIHVPTGRTVAAGINTVNDAAGGTAPGFNVFERLYLVAAGGVLTRGFVFGGEGTDGNNDFLHIRDCEVQFAVEAGFSIENSQVYNLIFDNCETTGGEAGLRTDKYASTGGSFTWRGGEIGGATDAAFVLKTPAGPIHIQGIAFEGCTRFIRDVATAGAQFGLTLEGARCSSIGLHADGVGFAFKHPGPIILRGNYIGDAGGIVEIDFSPGGGGAHCLIVEGNVWVQATAIINSIDDIFTGAQKPMRWGPNFQIHTSGTVVDWITPSFYFDRNVAIKALAVAFTASWTPNADAAHIQRMTLTANLTINAPTKAYTGHRLIFELTQDATGGRTMTFNAVFKKTWTPVTTANALNTIEFYYNGTNWLMVGKGEGLS